MQTFRKLREEDCYYVDKTPYIERLLDQGRPLFPVTPAAVRQEPVPGHAEGAVRGQRGTVHGAAHPRPRGLELVGAPPGGAAGLRRRELQGAGLPPDQPGGAVGRHGGSERGESALRHGARTVRLPDQVAARAQRAAGGGAGGRVRQADPGRAGDAGDRPCQPRLPARPVRRDQGARRARAVHVRDRGKQVHQGEPVFRPEQSHRHHPGSALLGDLRVHGG